MNDFVVSFRNTKKEIKVINENKIQLDGESYDVELSKVNSNSYLLKVGNKVYDITSSRIDNENFRFLLDGRGFEVTVRTRLQERAVQLLSQKAKLSHHDEIKAPMPGLILKLNKKMGDRVEIGEAVLILEAMKMENEIRSPSSGKIKEINIAEGDSVEKGTLLIKIE